MGQACSAPGAVLVRAARCGDHQTVQRCISEDASLLRYHDSRGRNLLFLAAKEGQVGVLKVFAESFNIASQCEQQQRQQQQQDVQRCHSSPPHAQSISQYQEGASSPQPSVSFDEYLNQLNDDGENALIAACSRGKIAAVSCLLALGADPCTLGTGRKSSCLHRAVLSGSAECVAALLRHSTTSSRTADGIRSLLDLYDSAGYTPLLYACQCGYAGIVKLLLEYGACTSLPIRRQDLRTALACLGCTPLHLAAMYGFTEMVKMLMEARVTALSQQNVLVPGSFRLVWEGDADRDPRLQRNARGETPYQCAAKYRNGRAATYLDPTIPVSWVVQVTELSVHGRNFPKLSAICRKTLLDYQLGWLDQFTEKEAKAAECQSLRQRPDNVDAVEQPAASASECRKNDGSACSSFVAADVMTDSDSSGDLCKCAIQLAPSLDEAHGKADADSTLETLDQLATASSDQHSLHWRSVLWLDGADDEEKLCGVCLDKQQQVILKPCNHKLCAKCAVAIVKHPCQSLLCPYCRNYFGLFEEIIV